MSLAVVLAGGGCRTAWSVGFLEELRAELPEPSEWAGVSAGACMAVGVAARAVEPMMECFLRLASASRRNFYPERLGRGPVFPHEAIYRETVASGLAGGTLDRLRAAGPVRILLAYVAPGARFLPSFWSALRGYRERKRTGALHGPDAPPPGLGVEVVTAQALGGAAAIEDAVLASSATPFVTRLPRDGGRTYVDGGFVENVPVRALSEPGRAGRVLVLLTRPAAAVDLPRVARRLYVAPERDVPIAKWDYASPTRLEATFEIGRRDGRRLRERVLRWADARLAS
ncbi:MAG: patatin-like phospholipase family protein [Thermodesulfobacteriota bacterium]